VRGERVTRADVACALRVAGRRAQPRGIRARRRARPGHRAPVDASANHAGPARPPCSGLMRPCPRSREQASRRPRSRAGYANPQRPGAGSGGATCSGPKRDLTGALESLPPESAQQLSALGPALVVGAKIAEEPGVRALGLRQRLASRRSNANPSALQTRQPARGGPSRQSDRRPNHRSRRRAHRITQNG